MINFFQTGNASECCGCSACVNACPKQCISFRKNDEGFLYPIKDLNVCIDCGLCENVCPFSDNYTYETPLSPGVYAAYDKENRSGSSSGGIFYTLAKYAIEERKGWVFGAAFEGKFQLCHVGVNNMSDLYKLRGSKYLQSDMRNCYHQIRLLLRDGTFVLFVGTPCQVAGLRAFLRNKQYDNLLLADLVCHGVPPQSLFDEHVKYLVQKHNATLVSYQFRRLDGWGVWEICDFTHPTKSVTLPSYDLSPYLYSFMHAMTYRESCYECKFSKVPRQGDITLADYWGVRNFFPNIDATKGVSLVLVNTEMGRDVWDGLKQSCFCMESNIEDGAQYNGNLVKRSVRPNVREDIYKQIDKYGYRRIAETLFRIPNYTFLRFKIFIAELPVFKILREWIK